MVVSLYSRLENNQDEEEEQVPGELVEGGDGDPPRTPLGP